MFTNRPSRRGAFTLVEMLVVLGIIAILIALLMPAVMAAVNRGRITRMATEIAQLKDAIEKYKTDKGDYPPNLRGNPQAVINHIRRCYPKIVAAELNLLWDASTNTVRPAMQLDEGESLVFWLAATRNNPQFPFGLSTGSSGTERLVFYDFPAQRLIDSDGDSYASFRPEYAKESFYLYVDSRSYLYPDGAGSYSGYAQNLADTSKPENPCVGESDTANPALPYWTEASNPMSMTTDPNCLRFLPQNERTYQILCAGQDGDFGYYDATSSPPTDIKVFPGGDNYTRGDKDNITEFSAGRRLMDHIP